MAFIDMRKEFDALLNGDRKVNDGTPVGFWVLYQRGSRKVRCSCWDPRQQEPAVHCPQCMASGWVFAFERHKTVKSPASQVVSYPHLKRQSDPGQYWAAADRFFLRYDVAPQVGDRIMQVGWNGNIPVNLVEVHEINHVEPVRGDNGRVEYYWAASRTVVADFPFLNFVIRTIGGQNLYIPRFTPRGEGL